VKPTALLLLAENRPLSILVVAIAGYAVLALGYSVSQWSYAVRFRREWIREELADRRRARRHGGGRSEYPAVDVIVPCYNEKPRILQACCEALERQREQYPGPMHVWIVDDGSQTIADLEPVYRGYEALPGWTVLHHQRNRGKRRAQDSAFRQGAGDYVITVDSDTTLKAKCVVRLVNAMERNRHAGAISGHVTARNRDVNRFTALIDRRYEFLFRQERAAQSWHKTVTCCSGPVSIYRRSVLVGIWRSYVEDTFLGRQRQFGDDLKLSLLVIEQTHDSLYWPSAKGLTNVPEDLPGYAPQQVRWNKSFYRELPRAYRALRVHLRSPRFLELRRARYLGPRRARYLGPFGAHRYVRFELAARALVPLLPQVLLVASLWSALTGRDGVHWLPLLALIVVMLTQALVVGLQAGSWTFPLLYGPLHLVVLALVRLRALATLTDSRWGTRGTSEMGGPALTAAPVTPGPPPHSPQPAVERAAP
jgi:N-acetylglucosaminyltransferase